MAIKLLEAPTAPAPLPPSSEVVSEHIFRAREAAVVSHHAAKVLEKFKEHPQIVESVLEKSGSLGKLQLH